MRPSSPQTGREGDTSPAGATRAVGVGRWVLLFYAALFLLSSGGRMGSADAFTQLQAATLLVTTGRIGSTTRPAEMGWLESPQGIYYEIHDFGAIGLMAPAAWVGLALTPAPALEPGEPSLVSRVGAALTYALVGAVGAFFAFRLFALLYPPWTAFLLSLVFATCTIYWPYAKCCWDVLPGCTAVCAVLYYSGHLLSDKKKGPVADALALGIAAALATAFRVSLVPFLLISIVGTLWLAARNPERRTAAGHGVSRRTWVSVTILAPFPVALSIAISALYNFVRTGDAFRTGATGSHTLSSAAHNDILEGLWGLLLSPNRGLLAFAPIFVLLFALPLLWRRVPPLARTLFALYGTGAALYILFIARLSFWGSFGWGPRYLVPVLPILFLGVAASLATLWPRFRRPLVALVTLSLVLNLAPVLVNWHLASTEYPPAMDMSAPGFHQHEAVWRGLWYGLGGMPLPMSAATFAKTAANPVRRQAADFPDLWTFRLLQQPQPAAKAGGVAGLAALIAAGIFTLRQLTARLAPATQTF